MKKRILILLLVTASTNAQACFIRLQEALDTRGAYPIKIPNENIAIILPKNKISMDILQVCCHPLIFICNYWEHRSNGYC